jgi:predicted metal-dependent enzyme (double-stranded beta helix superfamily)
MQLQMDTKLEHLARDFHDYLKAEPGAAGREKVAQRLKDVLTDDDFLARHFADTGTRKVLYEDPELSFCILAHQYQGAAESRPHDHGPSWAIYGQAEGETEMTEWEVVEPAAPDKPGKVRAVKTYTMTPGSAYVYNEGKLHSPRRFGATRLIRIEGQNLDGIKRLSYEPV